MRRSSPSPTSATVFLSCLSACGCHSSVARAETILLTKPITPLCLSPSTYANAHVIMDYSEVPSQNPSTTHRPQVRPMFVAPPARPRVPAA